jgi:formate-dependent nitrite reductase membrane component NrfD/ferredoxin
MYRRPDGIVDFDKAICIGCKACIAACPYDAIFINPEDHAAEKCNFCAHRLDQGLEPACVVVCPTQAILVGDLRDPDAAVARIAQREAVTVRRPEKETRPKLFYKGAHQATLDPLAARRPDAGLFMWSEQPRGADLVPSGHPAERATSSAEALLSYDVAHRIPWDWRVSLYTWTKSLAAGAYLLPVLLVLTGLLPEASVLWRWAAPLVALTALAATGALLIWDLEHPERFYLIFTRPQWRSWLVRGGVILAGYGVVLSGHLAAALAARHDLLRPLAVLGLPLALAAAVYTAYLFAQARARDLWQNPLLPPHLAVQAVLAGAGALALAAAVIAPLAVPPLLATLAGAALVHLLVVAGEVTLTHGTAHARVATAEMLRGRYRRWFWAGVVLVAPAAFAPWLGPAAAIAALAGLFAFEHAYVQAGQCVPLA